NLHVSRNLDQRDGFLPTQTSWPPYNKRIDNFEPRMIQFQKQYAKDILTHVNPYTKLAYVDDPGVAMIEINNENSMVAIWYGGGFDQLEGPYLETLRAKWNEWLTKKYSNQATLAKAWNCRVIPFGQEMIPDGNFPAGTDKTHGKYWTVQGDHASEQVWTLGDKDDVLPVQSRISKLVVHRKGTVSWIPQIHRNGLNVQKGQVYTLSFWLRSTSTQPMSVGIVQDHDPWESLGFRDQFQPTNDWKYYCETFAASDDDPKVRLSFGSINPGTYELAAVSLRKGGRIGLAEGVTLENKNIDIPRRFRGSLYSSNETAQNDWSAFLFELENGYWQQMYHYIKNDLKAKQPVTGTQLNYGFLSAQAALDYCDIHSYWNHPRFPRVRWAQNDWYLGERSHTQAIAGEKGTIPQLGIYRVIGKPLTVSEYDHPYPNLYAAEGNLMLAAVGAFQNWSGLFQFAWSHTSNFDTMKTIGFFDMYSNTAKLAHLPACYAMFYRGDVKRGPGHFVFAPSFTQRQEEKMFADSVLGKGPRLAALNLKQTMALAVYSGLEISDVVPASQLKMIEGKKRLAHTEELPDTCGGIGRKQISNEFNEIFWGFDSETSAFFKVDTAGTKVYSGFLTNRVVPFRGVTLEFGKTCLNWATVSMVSKNKIAQKTDILPKGQYLVAVTGLVQNKDTKLVRNAKERQISAASHLGGSRGTAPVVCEGVPLNMRLTGVSPENITVYALDCQGNRQQKLPIAAKKNDAIVVLGPQYKTVWYELVIE
ncbi:MAG: carbohydrate binding domain-containing protein, partial [Thermoguttaceae bacterium]|nr:carbohydrate binding domain-containing protein [Thermoguttaceae bacterium]